MTTTLTPTENSKKQTLFCHVSCTMYTSSLLKREDCRFKNWMFILLLLCENERQRWDESRYIKARSEAQRFYVYRDASHLWRSFSQNRTKTYNYRHCDTSMSLKTADYFPSGEVIATLLGTCKVICYANMNVTLFLVSGNQMSVFSITQQSRYLFKYVLHIARHIHNHIMTEFAAESSHVTIP